MRARLNQRFDRAMAIAIALLFAACGGGSDEDSSLEPAELSSQRLTVEGRLLLDELGREVLLRGFNVGNRAKMPPFLPFEIEEGDDVAEATEELFTRIDALGPNVIRLTFGWEPLEPTEGSIDFEYIERYRLQLDAAHARGMRVLVDFHQDVFASPFCGDGFPIWAIGDEIPHGEPRYDCGFPDWALQALDSESDVSRAFDRIWYNTDNLQDKMEEMWRFFATEVHDHPAVIGFEIINEPGPGTVEVQHFESVVLPELYERMGAAIRDELGDDFPIFGGGRTGDATGIDNHLEAPDLPGFVFAPHFYDAVVTLGGRVPQRRSLLMRVENLLRPAVEWGVPVFLGEFGVMNTHPNKALYLEYIYDALDENVAHGTLWDASTGFELWNSEDFSVFTATGEEQWWADSVVRPYPRAVAGHIERIVWSAEENTFELDVSGAREGVSEIYLPARHLGTRPRIEVTGARYRFLRDRELLLVAAEEGESYQVVVSR